MKPKSINPVLLVIFLSLSSHLQANTDDACVGETEALLVCHADEVKEFLHQWVIAWGNGDVEQYLSMYSDARSPVADQSRQNWEAERRNRISPDKDIEINLKLESVGLEDSGIFDVIFEQQYRSNNYRDSVRKRLSLVLENDSLKIWKEELLQ